MPQTTTITASDLQQKRGDILKRCYKGKEHFIVEKQEMPIVAIIPIEEYQAKFGRPETE